MLNNNNNKCLILNQFIIVRRRSIIIWAGGGGGTDEKREAFSIRHKRIIRGSEWHFYPGVEVARDTLGKPKGAAPPVGKCDGKVVVQWRETVKANRAEGERIDKFHSGIHGTNINIPFLQICPRCLNFIENCILLYIIFLNRSTFTACCDPISCDLDNEETLHPLTQKGAKLIFFLKIYSALGGIVNANEVGIMYPKYFLVRKRDLFLLLVLIFLASF
eukprot:gene6298-4532_t